MQRVSVVFFLLLFDISGVAARETEHIQFFTHNVSGSSFIDDQGRLRGIPHTGRRAFNIELIRAMMGVVGYTGSIKILPFKRAVALLKENKAEYALFNIGRRASRDPYMKWVGPLQTDEIYFYDNPAFSETIRTLNDARSVSRICLLNGSSHHTMLTRMGFSNLHFHISYSGCFRMLEKGRTDLAVLSSFSLKDVLNGGNISAENIRNTGVLLHRSEGQLAFSNKVTDDTVSVWQAALDQLKASGEYQKLAEQYLY